MIQVDNPRINYFVARFLRIERECVNQNRSHRKTEIILIEHITHE